MKKESSSPIKQKILRYCAYQERAHSEVRNKLFELGAYGDELEEIISYLIVEGFLNEERFAKTFAGGKFRLKKWGRLKIQNALEGKSVSKNCIKAGLKEINDDDYLVTLTSLIERKTESITEENVYVKRGKISQYVIQKGFEPELVWKILREVVPDR
jgi:regulatory protein